METNLIEVKEVNKETALSLQTAFTPLFRQAKEFEVKAKTIVVTDKTQIDAMKEARDLRLSLKNIRIETEKLRKDMKAETLRKGKAIDGVANIIKYLVVPLEEHLQKQEDFVRIQQIEEAKKKLESRQAEITSLEADPYLYNLNDMNEEVYVDLITSLKKQKADREAEAERIEKERLENERLDRIAGERRNMALLYKDFWTTEEYDFRGMSQGNFDSVMIDLKKAKHKYTQQQELIRQENERLKKEAIEREAIEAKARKERAEKEKELKAKADVERKKREQAEAKLEAEQEAKKKAEWEAEEKKRKEAIDKEKAEAEAKAAPDKMKLEKLAAVLTSIELPKMNTPKTKLILKNVVIKLNEIIGYIKKETIE